MAALFIFIEMKSGICFLCFLAVVIKAQTIEQCKRHFDTYLNFRGALSNSVKFENDAFYLLHNGKKEFAVYANEVSLLAHFFKNTSVKQQQLLFSSKKLRRFSKKECDSLANIYGYPDKKKPINPELPLKGYRIAIDPGHFSTSMKDAESEQKYLFFVPDSVNAPLDTVKIFESILTYNTGQILKVMLEEKGAEVFVTRAQSNFTSFNCTYTEWIGRNRKRVLDSLKAQGGLSVHTYKKLLNCNEHDFFWEFFRDYDLANRAKKINAFKPDATVIIHYNVDEKNAPWKQHSKKNFSMAFIGGAFTTATLQSPDSKMDFLRLLLTDQANHSEFLSAQTVSHFKTNLKVPVATSADATYLAKNCLATGSPGVFCRNLALCRKVNSPLVYGESLYQDNEYECKLLMNCDKDIYGVKANERLGQVALSYYAALLTFFKTRP